MSGVNEIDSRRIRGAGAVAVSIGLILGVATSYVATGNTITPLRLPYGDELEMSVIAPQGWKFFTKDPHEERLFTFRLDETTWLSASRGTNAEPSNLLGMSRDGRTQSQEAALLMKSVPTSAWKTCDAAIASCLASDADAVRAVNSSPRPTLCGTIGLVLQKPVPWEWARLSHPAIMPSRFVRVEVQC